MADVTGTVYAEHNGARYPLRLTMRSMGALQREFGKDIIARIQQGNIADFDFDLIVRSIELSLANCNPSMDPKEVAKVTDDIGTIELFSALFEGLFPAEAEEDEAPASGNRKRPKRAA